MGTLALGRLGDRRGGAGGIEMGTRRRMRKNAKGERKIPDPIGPFGQGFGAPRDSLFVVRRKLRALGSDGA